MMTPATCRGLLAQQGYRGDVVLEQPSRFGERAVGEHRVIGAHVEKPAEQQVVVELLTEHPVAADRAQRHQDQHLEGAPAGSMADHPAVHLVEPLGHWFSTSCQTSLDGMRHFKKNPDSITHRVIDKILAIPKKHRKHDIET
jgi:hypothetical protein